MAYLIKLKNLFKRGMSPRKSANKFAATSILILFYLLTKGQSNITRVEYYIDTDPGFGKATAVSITPSTNIVDKVIAINPASISEAVHRFYIRAMNASGAWGFTNSLLFYKPITNNGVPPAPPAAATNITKLEYYIDVDPGYGKARNVIINPGLDIKDVTIAVDITNLALGKHMFYVRAVNAKGAWSMMNALEFSNGVAPTTPTTISSISPISLCSGDTLKINGANFTSSLDPNVQSVKINAIQGTIVSATSDLIKAIFNQAVAGKVIVSNSNGIDTSSETATILAVPTVNSITNQEVCVGVTTTAILFSGTGTSYSWINNNTGTGLAASGTGNIAAFISKNVGTSQIASTITVTPLNTNVCKGIPTSFNILVDPILTAAPVISQSAILLSINSTPSGSGITGYQWMKDSIAIPGANNSTYQPLLNGIYSAAFTNICGKGPKSNAINFVVPISLAKGIYVDSSATSGLNNGLSWVNAFTRLQDALVIAKSKDTILVAKGNYYPDLGKNLTNDDRNLSFNIPDGVVVLGGFPVGGGSLSSRNWVNNKTVLSGEIQQDGISSNNSFHVILSKQVSAATILDGFTISGGNANSTTAPDNYGGGWYNEGSGNNIVSNPTIKNCIFMFNHAAQGGALFNNADIGGNASPIIINSRFLYNTVAGGNGGALYNLSTNNGNSSPQVTNCIFNGNQANYGAAIVNNAANGNSNTKIINCLLYNNSASDGAASYNIGNQGTCVTTFINSIIWANKFTFANSNASVNISYSITDATTGYSDGGNNKIGQNPFFLNINGDYHLQSISPAINSGNNAANPLSIDLDGGTRIINNIIDMGPFEYPASALINDLTETRSTTEASNVVLYQNIPNPFDHHTKIGVRFAQEGIGILKITDLLGRTIKVYDRTWNKGYNEIKIDKSELNQSGVYYYSFESPNFKATRKMILIR